MQAEEIRDASRRDRVRRTGTRVRVGIGKADELTELRRVVVRRHAEEYRGAAAGEGRRRHAGVLEGLPRDLQQQAMLRIDARRFTRGHAEEAGVELVHVLEETAPLRVGL